MEKRIYTASEGMTFRRKRDSHIMGNRMILGNLIDGTPDTIDNYEEVVDENPIEDNPRHRRMPMRGRMNPHRPSLKRK